MSSLNTIRAQVNEILLGYYILDSDWSKFSRADEVQACLKKRRKSLSTSDWITQSDRAIHMAKAVKKFTSDSHINTIHWTASAGELQRAIGSEYQVDKGNPTDILMHFSDDTYLGVSAKSIQTSYHHHIAIKNPGLGTIEKDLNIDLSCIKRRYEEAFVNSFSLPKFANARKERMEHDNDLIYQGRAVANSVLNEMRDKLYFTLSNMPQNQLKAHLKTIWLNCHKDVFPKYIIVAGHPNRVTLDIPTNKRLRQISLEKCGKNTIGIYTGNERLIQIRFKYSSLPCASTIKMCGHYW